MQHECVTPTAEWGLKKSESTVRVEIVFFVFVACGGSPVRLSGHLEPKISHDHLEDPTLPRLLLLSLALIACLTDGLTALFNFRIDVSLIPLIDRQLLEARGWICDTHYRKMGLGALRPGTVADKSRL